MTSNPELHKADFDDIYDQPDPRAYYSTLEPYDYVIPQYGAELFARLLERRATGRAEPPTMLDVCCSYGVVSTILKTGLDIKDLYAHYGDPETQSLSAEQLIAADRRLLQEHRQPDAPDVVGLDVAENAVAYALTTGALDAGVSENLEENDPSPQLAQMLGSLDLIATTGGIGYVSERTFDRLLQVVPDSVWVASFCLRTYDYGPIADRLGQHGLSTESVPRTFRQRRFTGPEEKEWAVSEVRSRGFDPTGKEEDGYHHAQFYLSRPAREVAEQPLDVLLPEQF